MIAVRYAARAALVVWLGAMQTPMVAGPATEPGWIEYACGGVLVLGLFAMKFVGPPPRAFRARLAIAVVMLLVTAYGRLYRAPAAGVAIDMILGFVQLAWYARE